jgi:hypothetical protein
MGAQKLECEQEKNNVSLLSNAMHRTAQTAKIDLSEFHGPLYEIEFAIYAREVFLEGQEQNENIKVWCGRLCHFLAHIG